MLAGCISSQVRSRAEKKTDQTLLAAGEADDRDPREGLLSFLANLEYDTSWFLEGCFFSLSF